MGALDSLFGRRAQHKEADPREQAEELELLHQEIRAHQESGNGTIHDERKLKEITDTLAGLRARMEKSAEDKKAA